MLSFRMKENRRTRRNSTHMWHRKAHQKYRARRCIVNSRHVDWECGRTKPLQIDLLLFFLIYNVTVYKAEHHRTAMNVTTSPRSLPHVESKILILPTVECILRVCIIDMGGMFGVSKTCGKFNVMSNLTPLVFFFVFIAPVTNASLNSSNYHLDVTYYDFQ